MTPLAMKDHLAEALCALDVVSWNFCNLSAEEKKDILAGAALDREMDEIIELAVDLRREMDEAMEDEE